MVGYKENSYLRKNGKPQAKEKKNRQLQLMEIEDTNDDDEEQEDRDGEGGQKTDSKYSLKHPRTTTN